MVAFELAVDQLGLPALVVEPNQGVGWVGVGVEQGHDQAVDLTPLHLRTGLVGVGQGEVGLDHQDRDFAVQERRHQVSGRVHVSPPMGKSSESARRSSWDRQSLKLSVSYID